MKQFGRHDAIGDNFLVVIDVVDKQIQRFDSLFETTLDRLPIIGLDDPRYDIKRKNPLGPLVATVNGKGNPHLQQCRLRSLLPTMQIPGGEILNSMDQRLGGRARKARCLKQFIKESVRLIAVKLHR